LATLAIDVRNRFDRIALKELCVKVYNSIEDLRRLAKQRVPKAFFEYLDHGAYDELTLRRNRTDLEAICFRQRVLVDVAAQQLATTILGQKAAMPLAIGPIGMGGLVHGDGEIHAARAAKAFGIPYTMSTVSICSIEDVREAVGAPFWFQLYVMKDRAYTHELVDRAKAAGCPVLMMTVDIPVSGLRRRDPKNGLAVPPRLTFANAFDIATKPRWAWNILRARRRSFGNLAAAVGRTKGLSFAQWIASQFDPSVTWKDLETIRQRWPGKLVVKGILDPSDARQAAALGADAIVVSNHGGRQLDGTISTIAALPSVLDAIGDRCEVLLDGGVRSGQDILRAVSLGARACITGRAFLYGLGAMGELGVRLALEIMAKELQTTMALTGCNDVREAGRHLLYV
jgi:L-lactate dehydrogenase (cytochrome)